MALGVLACVLALVKLGELYAERDERHVHLHVDCDGGSCSASVNGGPTLSADMPAKSLSTRVGLYYFHPAEYGPVQLFRNLSLRPKSRFAKEVQLPLNAPDDLLYFERDPGWKLLAGRGLTHQGPPRERSVALLGPGYRDFTLDVDLLSSEDAGVMLRAADAGNGLLFVVRTSYNDAFFSRLEQGLPGPMLGIMPLGELTVAHELLRLAGLAAEILLAALGLLLVLRWASRLPPLAHPVRALAWLAAEKPPRWLVPVLFAATLAAAAWVAWSGFGAMPHIDDEGAYLFQAKIFAQGQLWAPPPPLGEFFAYQHLVTIPDRWFGKYPPLFPLLLTLGVLAGVPWLVDPILAAIAGLVIYHLTREVADWRWGILAWILALSSPFFLMLGGSMMAHTTAALLIATALLLAIRGLRLGSFRLTLGCGACLGLAVLARPYTALLATIAVGGYYAAHVLRGPDRARTVRLCLALAGCIAAFAAAFLGWNLLLTSPQHPTTDLYSLYDRNDVLGFGPDKGMNWRMTWGGWGHTPAKGLRSIHRYLDSTSRHLLGWPGRLSLALFLAGAWSARRKVWLGLFLGLGALLVVGHMLYWAVLHIGFGARYWFEVAPAMFVLSALGMRWASRAGARAPGGVKPPGVVSLPGGRLVAVAVVAACMLWSLTQYWPARWTEMAQYGGVTVDIKREIAGHRLDNALIFVWTDELVYNEGFPLNDPFLRKGPIFARDLGPRNRELIAAYPTREPYLWTRQKRLLPLGADGTAPAAILEAHSARQSGAR